MKTSTEFKVGKHDIGLIDSDFFDRVPSTFQKTKMPTFQTLPRYMADADIEKELTTGLCTLGDIFAFLENPPEGSKDGYANLFYTGSYVVGVGWDGDYREWFVSSWNRDDHRWSAGLRAFSPATQKLSTAVALGSSELPDELTINGVKYKRV